MSTTMSTPVFAEDSNTFCLAPNLSATVDKLKEDADKFDNIMAFFITIMAEYGYRVACLYDENNNIWSKEFTEIPKDWKCKNIYDIDFLLYKRSDIRCKIIAIPIGDWMVLNLMPKVASSGCKTRSMSFNVVKHVNTFQKDLGKFWHLKELALRYKNNLLAPLHGELMLEIGMASPSLQGLPQEIKSLIADMLDKKSRMNLEETCQGFNNTLYNVRLSS